MITRRSFLKKSACMTGGALPSSGPLSVLAQTKPQGSPSPEMTPDLVAVKSKDGLFVGTQKAIQELGGIEAFVRRGDRVGILVNSPFKNVGASVNPEVVLAVLEKCLAGGAKEIRYLKDPHRGNWDRSPRSGQLANVIKSLKYERGEHVNVEIPGGVALKEAKVTKDLFE